MVAACTGLPSGRDVSRTQSGGRRAPLGEGWGTRWQPLRRATHGIGIFLWAMLMVSGLGALLVAQPAWFDAVRALGALFLLYLGARALLQNIEESEAGL